MDRIKVLGTVLGASRVALGATFVASPRRAAAAWLGSPGDAPMAVVLGRALGGRDMVLGLTAIAAANGPREHLAPSLRLSAWSDVADALASALSPATSEPWRRIATTGTAALAAATCFAAAHRTERALGGPAPRNLSQEVSARVGATEGVDLRAVDRARV